VSHTSRAHLTRLARFSFVKMASSTLSGYTFGGSFTRRIMWETRACTRKNLSCSSRLVDVWSEVGKGVGAWLVSDNVV